MEVIQRSTSTVLTIPPDIIDHIIDIFILLTDSDSSERGTSGNSQGPLATLSTICSAFAILIQQRLFSERRLNTSTDYGPYNAFFARRPHLASYTRYLTLKLRGVDLPSKPPSESTSDRFPTLTQVLRRFTSVLRLKVIGVAAYFNISWWTLSPDLQSAILYVSRLPSLISLSLVAISQFDLLELKPSSIGQTPTLSHMAEVEDGEGHGALPLAADPASQETPGYSTLSIDCICARAWGQLVKRFSLSITHLEVAYPSTPLHVNLSDLPSLVTLEVCVWLTRTRDQDAHLPVLLHSATATTATTTAMAPKRLSGITDIDCTIEVFYPSTMRDACAGIDAALSGAGYQRLHRFSLQIECGVFDEETVLRETGAYDLEAYYREQLVGVAARGVLDLKVLRSIL